MLNLNAKQISDLQISRLDNATLLSCVTNMSLHVQHSEPARTKLGTFASDFVGASEAYDVAYNPSQKDLLSDVLAALDKVRDKSMTAWHGAILAAQNSPNEQKAMTARQLVQLYKDYKLDAADEYMKQTTNISQMIQAIEGNAGIMAALPGMGLDEYLADLKAKNEAFAAKMAERTAGTVGREKGVVSAARTAVEQALRNLIRATNIVSAYEGDGGLDQFIDTMNAEMEHFRDILARKGGSSSTNQNQGGQNNQNGNQNGNLNDDENQNPGGSGEGGGDTPGSDTPGGGDNPSNPSNPTEPGGNGGEGDDPVNEME